MTNSEKSAEEKVRERWPDAKVIMTRSIPNVGYEVFASGLYRGNVTSSSPELAWKSAASRLPNAPQTED